MKSEQGGGVLSLEVQAVAVTGTLIQTKLSASYQQLWESLLFDVDFKKDATILTVLVKAKDGWIVDSGGIGFMPKGCGTLVVNGVDDPAITPILEQVKKLREKK